LMFFTPLGIFNAPFCQDLKGGEGPEGPLPYRKGGNQEGI
jgi:hypothetical protein